jgi:hypothetical protein
MGLSDDYLSRENFCPQISPICADERGERMHLDRSAFRLASKSVGAPDDWIDLEMLFCDRR